MNNNKINFYLVIIVEALVCISCTALACNYFYENKQEKASIITTSNPDPDSTLAITTETLESGIREIQEFNTAQYYFSTVQYVSDSRKIQDFFGHKIDFKIPLTTNGFSYKYDGHVNAGVDFSKAKVTKDQNTIIVTLPKAEAHDVVFDSECEFLDINNNIFNPISPEDMTVSQEKLKEVELQNAIDKGLLNDAEKNAKAVILDFLKFFKKELKDYSIVVNFE